MQGLKCPSATSDLSGGVAYMVRSTHNRDLGVRTASIVVGGNENDLHNAKLLDNLSKEQAKLGNIKPGQSFTLADKGSASKSIQAIFATAGATNIISWTSFVQFAFFLHVQGSLP